MKVTTLVITGARQEYMPFIMESLHDELPHGEAFMLIRQKGADEALAHADAFMPRPEQYLVCDLLRTRAQLARCAGVQRCILMGSVSCCRNAEGFEECRQSVIRELCEVDEWHIFPDIRGACLTPEPEIVPIQ